jgi:hypothetical protein
MRFSTLLIFAVAAAAALTAATPAPRPAGLFRGPASENDDTNEGDWSGDADGSRFDGPVAAGGPGVDGFADGESFFPLDSEWTPREDDFGERPFGSSFDRRHSGSGGRYDEEDEMEAEAEARDRARRSGPFGGPRSAAEAEAAAAAEEEEEYHMRLALMSRGGLDRGAFDPRESGPGGFGGFGGPEFGRPRFGGPEFGRPGFGGPADGFGGDDERERRFSPFSVPGDDGRFGVALNVRHLHDVQSLERELVPLLEHAALRGVDLVRLAEDVEEAMSREHARSRRSLG